MKTRMRRYVVLFVSALVLLCGLMAGKSVAQVGGGAVIGEITDSNGAVVPSVSVAAINLGTNKRNETITNAEGYYEFPLLPAGRYMLEMQAANFQSQKSKEFDLNTGTRPKLDFTLGVTSVSEQVTVTETGQIINATNTELGVVIEQQKIDALPLNGRNFQQLVGLQAGVINAPPSATGGRGGIEFNGGYAFGNNILLDGVDASFGENNAAGSDIGAGTGGGGATINTISVDAIQEFKTTSSAFSAEYGRATGGVLNITTKSGTNDLRGTLYYFLRNDAFDANSFDNNRLGLRKPALRFNQFGGNVGGPVLFPGFGEGGPAVFRGQDRLFFFFNYEGARVTRPSVIQGNVPTPFLLAQLTNPATRTFLSKLPDDYAPITRTGGVVDPFFGLHRRNDVRRNVEGTYMTRLDANAGDHRLAFRYNYNNQEFSQPTGILVESRFAFPTFFHNFVAQDNWTISPNVLNEVRVGFNRVDLARNNSTFFTEPGWAEIPGLLTSDFQSLLAFKTNTYSLVDNLTYVRGKQTIKTGVDIRFLRSARVQDTNPTSFYNNVNDLIADNPARVRIAFGGPKELSSDQYAFYIQDDIRVTSRLQINPGLRYEYYTPLKGGFNIQSSDPFAPLSTERAAMFRKDTNNFAPRLGAVFDVFGNQKLVVRAGGAISYQPPQPMLFYDGAFADPRLPFNAEFFANEIPAGVSLAFPFPRSFADNFIANPSSLPARIILSRFITDYNRSDEYAMQFNLTAQYAVTPSLAVQFAYVGNRSVNHPFVVLPNECLPGTVVNGNFANCRRPRPDIGRINYVSYSGRNRYDAGQLSVNYRLRRNFAADFYYTYAKGFTYGVPDDSFGNGQTTLQDPTFNIRNSYGVKQSDIRHRVVGVYTVELPTPRFAESSRLGRLLLGGNSLQGIYNYRSGLPLNIFAGRDLTNNGRTEGSRPDFVAGVEPYSNGDVDSATGFPLWVNRAAFNADTPDALGRYGSLGYNALRGPSSWGFDTSLIKRFRFTETQHLDFRIEAFNAFNHANFNNPDTSLLGGNFGRIVSRSGPRNIQFGLKYFF